MRAVTGLLVGAFLFFLPNVARAADDEVGNKWTTTAKVEAGYERGVMYGRGMNGGRMRLGLGRQNDDMALWGTISGRYGATETGLRTWDIRLGGDSELWREGIFHLGAAADFGIHGYTSRAENDIGWALSFGLAGRLGIDVVKFGERNRDAVTLDGRLDAHLFLTGYYASAGIYLGVRF
jgi:hypothetical protein